MKILHVVHAYPPSVGGCQHLIERLSRELVGRHGDEVTVYTTVALNTEHFVRDDGLALPATTEVVDGVTVRRFRVFNRLTRPRMLLASLAYRYRLPFNEQLRTLLNGPIVFGLAGAVARSGADVVMASAFPLAHMYDALRGARRAGIPAVLLGALHVEDEWNYDREMIFRAARRADAYVALTEFERRHVIARGVAADRAHVVGGGVDVAGHSRAVGAAARRRFELGERPVVAMVAKHVARKRFDVLLRAMETVWRSVPDALLVMAGGRTPYTAEIEAMVAALGAKAASVRLLSDVEEEDKLSLLAACDVFVLPSAWDSFGLVFLEAWACRKPVVGAASGAVASLVADGEDGLLAPYEDAEALASAVVKLLRSPDLRRRMGERGFFKVTQRYSWETVTREMRKVYEQAAERHGRSRRRSGS
jgi:glycosyltransferase involved in cell wall biosynthesis